MAEFGFEDLIKDIAANKKSMAQTRFSKIERIENPKDVYTEVCQTIADYYGEYGFKYAKSKQTLTLKRKNSEFTYKISFSSSRYNAADRYVEVTAFANVLSKKYKQWQTENKIGSTNYIPKDFVAGGQIGNMQEKSKWLKWKVANPETIVAEVEDIIRSINQYAVPFFESFENIPKLISYIEKQGNYFGILTSQSLASFLMYVASKESVEKTFSTFLTKRQSWDTYESAMNQLKKTGKVPDGTYWSQIAFLTKQLGLKLEK